MITRVSEIDPRLQQTKREVAKDLKKLKGKEFDFDARLKEAVKGINTARAEAQAKIEYSYISHYLDLCDYRYMRVDNLNVSDTK